VKKRPPSPSLPGTIHANIQLPEKLHDQMKAIRQARRKRELGDVKLSRLYREAVEQYVAAEPQRQLLDADRKRRERVPKQEEAAVYADC
jgi:hypothetical protein